MNDMKKSLIFSFRYAAGDMELGHGGKLSKAAKFVASTNVSGDEDMLLTL